MLEKIADVAGTTLNVSEYLDDFSKNFGSIPDIFWKIERRQSFREPDVPSWLAMAAGDWTASLRLIEDMRQTALDEAATHRTFERRRLRFVRRPVTPYLQWELHVLKVREEAGEQIRVVDVDHVDDLESGRHLPEVVVLGSIVAYEVTYDVGGTLTGARRITAPDVIAGCRQDAEELFGKAENLISFFEREIAPLPPPSPPVVLQS